MNFYQRMWDGGYGRRWRRVMATNAQPYRKQAALVRIWTRMVERLDG